MKAKPCYSVQDQGGSLKDLRQRLLHTKANEEASERCWRNSSPKLGLSPRPIRKAGGKLKSIPSRHVTHCH